MGNFNIVKFEGKSFEKLIEVISQGIGTLYKPRAIRKEADARAYELSVLEKAKSLAKVNSQEIEYNSIERLLNKEQKRQQNIDKIAEIASTQFVEGEDISKENVDTDWSTRFFNIVEDISNEEMQNLWGRILAGEVKRPNSFSLRTLELLKNLSKNEAEIFTKFSQLKLSSNQNAYILNNDKVFNKFNITFNDRLLMSELGLINNDNNLVFKIKATDFQPKNTGIEYGNYMMIAIRKPNTPELKFPIIAFTKIGNELSSLISQNFNLDYLKELCSSINNPEIEYVYGLKMKHADGNHKILNPQKIEN